MSPVFVAISAVLVLAQFVLPRKLAFLPLLIAACHIGNVELFSNLTIVRLLILCGIVRAIVFQQFRFSFRNPVDLLFLLFAFFALISIPAHSSQYLNPTTERIGLIYNVFGTYLYARAFIGDFEDLHRYVICLALVLIPLGALLATEQASGRNPYAIVGARNVTSIEREGRKRASGPFSHAILAGTAGATALPLMVILLRRNKAIAITGMGACVVIAIASASSAPLASMAVGLGALALWRIRERIRTVQVMVILTLFALHMVMTQPVWYLMAKMDLAGGSTGHHRAVLIDSAIKNLHTWWLAGTDYTRNWTLFGVSWSPDHADITNYYLRMGVIGGLPLMLTFIAILVMAFRMLGKRMIELREIDPDREWILWCLGATLFAHCVNILSISYFDQMYALLFLLIGIITSLTREELRPSEDELGHSEHEQYDELPPMPGPFSKLAHPQS